MSHPGLKLLPAIKNFGYLWDRDRVFWGKGSQNGTLLGYHSKFGEVDFREQRGIYLLHTTDLNIVYVGQVGSGEQGMFDRIKQHTRSAALWNRWKYFSWFGWRGTNKTGKRDDRLTKYSDGSPSIKGTAEEFLDEIEAVLIQVVEPRLNRQGPRWKGTFRFDQIDDKRLKLSDLPTIATKQAEMMDILTRIEKAQRKK